jgi:hypothetical protein
LFVWFHIHAETPSDLGVPSAMLTIPTGPPARLYKREQRAPLTVCNMKHEKAGKSESSRKSKRAEKWAIISPFCSSASWKSRFP